MGSLSHMDAYVINTTLDVFKTIVICQSVYFIFILSKIILRMLGLAEKSLVGSHVY